MSAEQAQDMSQKKHRSPIKEVKPATHFAQGSNEVITDMGHPEFDLEKLLRYWDEREKLKRLHQVQ
jgi:hypothetical protein